MFTLMKKANNRGETTKWRRALNKLGTSIGTKIILPYLLLTLAVAGAGAFIVTNFVTGSLRERFNNQLLDAGRVVSESMVGYEQERLEILRVVANTEGVPEGLATGDRDRLATLVPQIIANSNTDAAALLNTEGIEVYGWRRVTNQPQGETSTGTDFSQLEEVRLVLDEYVDALGNKRVFLGQTPEGFMLFTVGPVYWGQELVGAVLVGSDVRKMTVGLTENAVARVTLYDRSGDVIATTLGDGQQSVAELLQGSPEQYEVVIRLLRESPEQYEVVTAVAGSQVPLRQAEILSQNYLFAYGDWRLRGRSFGLFSVALPSNFIFNAASNSRNLLSLVFSLATVAVFTIGFVVARRITSPLNRLVQVSTAVTRGNLEQRTGIRRNDEIGTLAASFDTMTEHLVERNRQLVEQASKLEAILHSIADCVIVFDMEDRIIASNPAAQKILPDLLYNYVAASSDDLSSNGSQENNEESDPLIVLDAPHEFQRLEIGSRVFSALPAPVETPEGDQLGRVVVLRDITREAEAEQLKDGFITSVSHELRTPLTAVKGYVDLLLMTGATNMSEQHYRQVKVISENTEQLVRHVNKLIEITEIQSSTLKLAKQQEHFSKLAAEAVVAWRERMEGKGLTLRLNVKDREMWVDGDAHRLVWAIDNLLQNAHDYTLSGDRVEVRLFRRGNEACIEVSDTGIGISTADQAHLFTRFFRVQDQRAFNVHGMGLGLFIVRSVVELHDGRVWAKSEFGVGSTFGFALPLLPEPVPAEQQNVPS